MTMDTPIGGAQSRMRGEIELKDRHRPMELDHGRWRVDVNELKLICIPIAYIVAEDGLQVRLEGVAPSLRNVH
jgi:hypothetical protein